MSRNATDTSPESLKRAAHDWADRGVPVFPLLPDNSPAIKGGFLSASTDHEVIERMTFTHGIGGVPGAAGYVVLDVDAKNGATLADVPLELLDTLRYRTRSNGWHLWARAEPGKDYGNGPRPDLGDALDVRFDRGYVALAPTPGYRLENADAFDAELCVPAPDVLVYQGGSGTRVEIVDAAPFEVHDDTLRQLGRQLEQGGILDHELRADVLERVAERHCPTPAGRAPFTRADYMRQARPFEPGSFSAQLNAGRLSQSDGDEPERTTTRRLEVVTLADVCRLPDPPASDRIIGDLVVRGQRTLVAGGTGEGKTTLVQQLVAAATAGSVGAILAGDCIGQTVHPVARVLVIDAEQGVRTIKRRAAEFKITERENIDYVRVPDGLRLDHDAGDVDALAEVLAARPYDVVVLDPFYKLHSGDSNSDREIKQLMATLDGWRERYGFALVMPTHTRKLAPGVTTPTIADVFGSSALTWGAEIVVMIQRKHVGYSHLHVVKDRDGEMSGKRLGLYFDRDDGGFTLDPESDKTPADKTDELRERVFEYIREHADCSQRQVVASVRGGEHPIRGALVELYEADRIAKGRGPNGGDSYAVIEGVSP